MDSKGEKVTFNPRLSYLVSYFYPFNSSANGLLIGGL